VSGKATALPQQEQEALMAVIRERKAAVQNGDLQAGQAAAREYLLENAKKEGISTTSSGLQYEVLTTGTGQSPASTDQVVVHYRGQLLNGVEFDSSYKRDKPAEFKLTQVIAGWTEGLQLMNKGAKYRFYIAPELGYGAGGVPRAGIPANAVLIFDVELLEIK
jgi:FKBP-type peptidyl-prolyl cis-trans isomerase